MHSEALSKAYMYLQPQTPHNSRLRPWFHAESSSRVLDQINSNNSNSNIPQPSTLNPNTLKKLSNTCCSALFWACAD